MSELFSGLPRKWKIGSYKFRIEIVSREDSLKDTYDGLTVFEEEKVYLSESMKPMRAAVVVMHEAIHIINWVFGVNDNCDEETITTQVSTGLLAFWQDNPKVMQWVNRVRKIHE